jgi:hypothetical protein
MSLATSARTTTAAAVRPAAAAASTLVLLGAAGLIASAAIHAADAPDTFGDATYLGIAFLAQAVASVMAAILAVRGSRLGLAGGLAIAGTSLAMYSISRTIGLPGQEGEVWLEPAGVVALVAEAITVVTFGLALATGRSR